MFKINKNIEYALISLKHIYLQQELINASDIYNHYKLPQESISKTLQIMARKGLVLSKQGINGGYTINEAKLEISFLDFIKLLGEEVSLVKCIENPCTLKETCNIIDPLQILNNKIKHLLSEISLKNLLTEDTNGISA